MLNTGGALEWPDVLRYPQRMTTAATPLSIYQLRIVLRGISPLIWRRLLLHSNTTLAHLHTCVAKKLKYPFFPVVLVSPLRVSLLDFTLATSHSL